ncbi:LD-carboxypeptidase [Fodinicola feengrottensis]|uniref:LD-carboxypeptidase n=1 Tax=Fodinicola feengrottensis TaxID=435914 RepID=A0ABP4T1M0_9ACTN
MLRPGDRVQIATAAHAAKFESWGLRVFVDTDLNSGLPDSTVRAIVTEGVDHRLLAGLDFGVIARDPKPVVGVNTYLHLAAGIPAVYDWGNEPTEELRRVLMETGPLVISADPTAYTGTLRFPGRCSGILVGGSLSALRGMIGAGLPSLAGTILLLTDHRTIGLGKVDRQLTHLRRAGALDGVRGVVVGPFPGFEDFTDRDWTVLDVLHDQLSHLGIPFLGGIPTTPVPLGIPATLDADAGTLVMATRSKL